MEGRRGTASLRLWRGRLSNLLLLLLSFGGTLLVAELGFRVAGFVPLYETYSKPSVLWQADPMLGWSHTPSQSDRFVGPRPWPLEFSNEVRINSHGLRGPELREGSEDGYRILFMGDSMVAGFEVADSETFVARVGQELDRAFDFPIETLNAGVRGYGTDQSYLYYRERGHALAADLVVFLHGDNDPADNMTLHRLRRPFGKPAFALEPDGNLRLLGVPVPEYPLCSSVRLSQDYRPLRDDSLVERAACWLEIRFAEHTALGSYLIVALNRSPRLLHWLRGLGGATREVQAGLQGLFFGSPAHATPEADPSRRLTAALLQSLAREVTEGGSHFLLWITESELEALSAAGFEAAGIDWRQIAIPRSRVLGYPLRFENDRHFNAFGHELIAEELAPILAERIERTRRAGRGGRQ